MEVVGYLSQLLKYNPNAQGERQLHCIPAIRSHGRRLEEGEPGDKSKTREVPESKRRACFKGDRAFNGVTFTGEGWRRSLNWHNGDSWRL